MNKNFPDWLMFSLENQKVIYVFVVLSLVFRIDLTVDHLVDELVIV